LLDGTAPPTERYYADSVRDLHDDQEVDLLEDIFYDEPDDDEEDYEAEEPEITPDPDWQISGF
jgi:hypothetical protein